MGITASTGPLIIFGSGTNPTDYNVFQGPSLLFQGYGLLDQRPVATYQPGQADTSFVGGWLAGEYLTSDYAPSTLAANNIAASQSPGAGAINLVSVSGAGITVGCSMLRMDNGATQTGLLGIDVASATSTRRVTFGQVGTIQLWDPTQVVGRTVTIASGGNDTGITFTVNGFDGYGQPMSETITGVSAGTASGKKAFKYILSVTHTGSVNTTVTVGTADIFGFPLRNDTFPYIDIYWNNAYITATTGYLAAVTSAPTATTGDVRGTYAVQSASDGTKRLVLFQRISMANISSIVGQLGPTQFATAF